MMNKLILISTFLGLPSAFGSNLTQYIDCHFPNPNSTEKVIVSLDSEYRGSFFYTTGLDDQGDDSNTGRLGLNRLEDTKPNPATANFLAQFMTVQDGSKITVNFNFSMPRELIFQKSDFFQARLTTDIIDLNKEQSFHHNTDDQLFCFSRLYSKE